MPFRLPQNLFNDASRDPLSPLEGAVMAEKAVTLGLAGRKLERTLAAFQSNHDPDRREALLHDAAEATHHYLIQRELCGLRDHRRALEDYQIPGVVMARVGAKRPGNR